MPMMITARLSPNLRFVNIAVLAGRRQKLCCLYLDRSSHASFSGAGCNHWRAVLKLSQRSSPELEAMLQREQSSPRPRFDSELKTCTSHSKTALNLKDMKRQAIFLWLYRMISSCNPHIRIFFQISVKTLMKINKNSFLFLPQTVASPSNYRCLVDPERGSRFLRRSGRQLPYPAPPYCRGLRSCGRQRHCRFGATPAPPASRRTSAAANTCLQHCHASHFEESVGAAPANDRCQSLSWCLADRDYVLSGSSSDESRDCSSCGDVGADRPVGAILWREGGDFKLQRGRFRGDGHILRF